MDDIKQLVQLPQQAIKIQQKPSIEEREKEWLFQLNHHCILPEIDKKRFQVLIQKRVTTA